MLVFRPLISVHLILFCLTTVQVSIISCDRFSLQSLLTDVRCRVSLAIVSLRHYRPHLAITFESTAA